MLTQTYTMTAFSGIKTQDSGIRNPDSGRVNNENIPQGPGGTEPAVQLVQIYPASRPSPPSTLCHQLSSRTPWREKH